MKNIILPAAFILLTTLFSSGQSEQSAMKSFKIKAKQADTLFNTPPIVLISEELESSPSGKINYLNKFEKIKVAAYDVQKTNSLVSPFIGYIVIKIRVLSNKQFGNVKVEGIQDNIWGFETVEQAREVNEFVSCTSNINYNANEWCYGDIKITYAYQNGLWIFKGIDPETENKIGDGLIRGQIERGVLDKYVDKK